MSNQAHRQVKSLFELTRIKAMGAAVSLVAISAMPVAASPEATASGLPACASRPEILKQLSNRFKEAPVAIGLSRNGSVIEVLTSDDGETWTILVSQPNGSSCLVAVGEGWQDVKHVAAKGERGA